MKIAELYEMQKALDARIIEQKGLQGVDLLPNTVLALQVEIAELANEWRGFKHWSKNQEPRISAKNECSVCEGSGDYNWPASVDFLLEGQEGLEYEKCDECDGTGELEPRNPLLEEYADCLHFFLSIARQLDLPEKVLFVPDDFEPKETTKLFVELLYYVGLILLEPENDRIINFRFALSTFYALGDKFGFSYDQITAAYVAKNKANYDRLATGY
ncbi:dUTP diphosphatase [Paenibacillus sp. GbtcB18]|uniref:dUTP diphosphatase n=1 Tax=Paenibacillus sp. GbtcB18 TaxID=2824763 RepID=UPI001C303473|nr:dUTP diphosphatase [Paenibacillus sp. GbtcB18]